MVERGVIYNVQRKQQINSFEGLKCGPNMTITPTDIDGLIEYNDKAYIILEIKYQNADVPRGQRVALERLVADLGVSGKRAVAIIGEHHVADTREAVMVAECQVREIYLSSQLYWRPPGRPMTVRECINLFLDWI